ncbi:MAG: DUF4157 domain-containing protein [Pyrinomonadaceae bacterium]|nr:DUF4157 domain-containing protein [Pyrinomonadaceae bacterium]
MAEAANNRTHVEKGRSSTPSRARPESQEARSIGMADDILALQRSAGNRAVSQLLQSGAASLPDENGFLEASNSNSQPDSQTEVLSRAAQESSQRLDASVRGPMEQALGVNLGAVRVHSGASSHAAAENLGAHAYTIGSDIYLGSDAQHLSPRHRSQLLAHEAVHTVQQGGRAVAIQGKMEVSQPGDGAEVEAENIARTIMSPRSSLAIGLRDHLRATSIPRHTISRVAAPLIQRDLKKNHPVDEGTWNLNLKTESHKGKKSGMSGTLKFKANAKAPDADQIRILQVARVEDLSTGKEYAWTGGEAARSKIMSPGGTGKHDPGYFVDALHATITPRTKKTDKEVSPYYIDYAGKGPNNKDGSKKGKAITEASIWDYPGWSSKSRFSFETVAKDSKSGHIFGSVAWGFTISDSAKGTVDHEWAYGRNVTLMSTDLAVDAFNKYYKNTGTPGAP